MTPVICSPSNNNILYEYVLVITDLICLIFNILPKFVVHTFHSVLITQNEIANLIATISHGQWGILAK